MGVPYGAIYATWLLSSVLSRNTQGDDMRWPMVTSPLWLTSCWVLRDGGHPIWINLVCFHVASFEQTQYATQRFQLLPRVLPVARFLFQLNRIQIIQILPQANLDPCQSSSSCCMVLSVTCQVLFELFNQQPTRTAVSPWKNLQGNRFPRLSQIPRQFPPNFRAWQDRQVLEKKRPRLISATLRLLHQEQIHQV